MIWNKRQHIGMMRPAAKTMRPSSSCMMKRQLTARFRNSEIAILLEVSEKLDFVSDSNGISCPPQEKTPKGRKCTSVTKSMIILAGKHYNNGDLDQRDDLLETLLRGSPKTLPADTQYRLGGTLLLAGNRISAENIFLSSAMNGHVLSAWNLQVFCSEKSLLAKQKVWIGHVKKNIALLPKSQSYNFRVAIEKAKKKFRELRGACASCGAFLNRSTRKLCGGCHTCCYCSRQCQKQHWNNRDCGHRTECIETQKLIESVKSVPRFC